jgi:hypothetical protein
MSDVFLSYSRKDDEIMRRIRQDLRSAGLTIWNDEENIPHGSPEWPRVIQNAIRETGCVIVILSPEAEQSEWVNRELALAQENNIRIFPLLYRGERREAVPARVVNHQVDDIRDDVKYASTLPILSNTIKLYVQVQRLVKEHLNRIKFDLPEDQINVFLLNAETAASGYPELQDLVSYKQREFKQIQTDNKRQYEKTRDRVDDFLSRTKTQSLAIPWERIEGLLKQAEQAAGTHEDLLEKIDRERKRLRKRHEQRVQEYLAEANHLAQLIPADVERIRSLLNTAKHIAVDIDSIQTEQNNIEQRLNSNVRQGQNATITIRRTSRRWLFTAFLVAIAALVLVVRFSNILDTRATPPSLDITTPYVVTTSTPNFQATLNAGKTQTSVALTTTALYLSWTPTPPPTTIATLISTNRPDYMATLDAVRNITATAQTAIAATQTAQLTQPG